MLPLIIHRFFTRPAPGALIPSYVLCIRTAYGSSHDTTFQSSKRNIRVRIWHTQNLILDRSNQARTLDQCFSTAGPRPAISYTGPSSDTKMNLPGRGLTKVETVFGRYSIRISTGTPAIQIEILCSFSQSLRQNVGTVTRSLPSRSCPIHRSATIRRYIM
jgi:hypothetical protein